MKTNKKYEANRLHALASRIAPAMGLATCLAITPLPYPHVIYADEAPPADSLESSGAVGRAKNFNKEIHQEELLCQQLEMKLDSLHKQQELAKSRQENKKMQERLGLLVQQLKKLQSERNLLAEQSQQDQQRLDDLQMRLQEATDNKELQLAELSKENKKQQQKIAWLSQRYESERKSANDLVEKQQLLYAKEREGLIAEKQQLQQDLAEAEMLLATQSEALENSETALENMRKQENNYSNVAVRLAKENQQLQEQLAEIEENNRIAMQKLEQQYYSQLAKQTKENENMRLQLASLSQSKKEHEMLTANLEGKNQMLRDEMLGHKNYALSLNKELQETQEQKKQLISTLNYTHDMLGMYQALFNERDTELAQISTMLQNAGYAMDSMRDSLGNVKDALASNDALKQQLQQTHSNFLELHKKADTIANQLESTREEFLATEELFHSALDAHTVLAHEHREAKQKLEDNAKVIAQLSDRAMSEKATQPSGSSRSQGGVIAARRSGRLAASIGASSLE